MRKCLTIVCCVLLVLSLAGCGKQDPYRVDTVVRIPVDPTEETVPVTEAARETTEETEVPAQAGTESIPKETEPPEETKPTSSGNKKPSGGKETEPTKPTEPESTGPEETEPEETESEMMKPDKDMPTEPDLGKPDKDMPTEPDLGKPDKEWPAETEPESTESPTEPPAEPEETEGAADPSDYVPGSLEYEFLNEINACRVEAGLEELKFSSRLSGIAAIRAEEVCRVWSHDRPDGRPYHTAMSDYGYGFSISAENLVHFSGERNVADLVAKWMSADNRESLLNPDFTTAGIGVYRSGDVTFVANLLVG